MAMPMGQMGAMPTGFTPMRGPGGDPQMQGPVQTGQADLNYSGPPTGALSPPSGGQATMNDMANTGNTAGYGQMPMVPGGFMGQAIPGGGMFGFNQQNQQTAAQPNINELAMQNISGASQATQREMGYMPGQVQTQFQTPMVSTSPFAPTVGTGGTTPQVTAGQLSSTDIGQYQNPYTQQVIDASMQDIERQRQMQQNIGGAQASAAGAFGGSRHGVAEALTNEAFARQGASTAAGLRQAGFDVARQMAGQDIAGRMTAGLANQSAAAGDLARQLQAQGMNQSAALTTAQRMLQAQMANQGAIQAGQQMGLGAQQFNVNTGLQGSQQRLGAAGQLGMLGQTAFGMGQDILGNMQNVGLQQTGIQQALIDAARNQYGGYTGYPGQALGFMGQALGVTPYGQTTTMGRQPGVFDYLTLGAMMGGR